MVWQLASARAGNICKQWILWYINNRGNRGGRIVGIAGLNPETGKLMIEFSAIST
jgi:hypothetical protein